MPLLKKRVLVMDDDEMVRNTAKAILALAEYEVDCAKDGSEAIEYYRKSLLENNSYSAVLLDVVVKSGVGGKETMRRLLQMDPLVNAIISSGYTEDTVMSDYSRFKFKGRISKPYRAEDLQKLVNEISNSRR